MCVPVFKGQWLNWQSSGLQNRRLWVRVPPDLPFSVESGIKAQALFEAEANKREFKSCI